MDFPEFVAEQLRNITIPGIPPITERTIADVFGEFTDEQKQVVYFMIGMAIEQTQADLIEYMLQRTKKLD